MIEKKQEGSSAFSWQRVRSSAELGNFVTSRLERLDKVSLTVE